MSLEYKEIRRTIQNLLPGQTYAVRVRANNEFGIYGPWSEALELTTDANFLPVGNLTTPNAPSVQQQGDSLLILMPYEYPNDGIVQYNLEHSLNGTSWSTLATTQIPVYYHFTTPDVVHYYRFSVADVYGQVSAMSPPNSGTITDLSNSGKPYATYVIAASNSIAEHAANADFVCDGIADDVELNAAIEAIAEAGGVGGKILLLDGDYYITSTVLALGVGANITFEGMGGSTILRGADGVDIFANESRYNAVWKSLTFVPGVGGRAITGDYYNALIDDCRFGIDGEANNCGTYIHFGQSAWASIINCHFHEGAGFAIRSAIFSQNLVITNNNFIDCGFGGSGGEGPDVAGGLYLENYGNGYHVIANNNWFGGYNSAINMNNWGYSVIANNTFNSLTGHALITGLFQNGVISGNMFDADGGIDIAMDLALGSAFCTIVGNMVQYGMKFRGYTSGNGDGAVIANNHITGPNGIILSDCKRTSVQGNTIDDANITIQGGCEEVLVANNNISDGIISDSGLNTSTGAGNFIDGVWEGGASGGGGGGTFTVYSVDAANPGGDYVCDGTNDQVEILAAINAAIALPYGGVVVLSEGNFNFGAALVMPNFSNHVQIKGQGAYTYMAGYMTQITMALGAGSAPIIDARTNNETLRCSGIHFQQNSTVASNCINLGTSGSFITDCSFDTDSTVAHRGIETDSTSSSELEVRGCNFFGTRGACIHVTRPYLAVIEDCYFYTGGVTTDYCVEVLGFNGTDYGPYDETFFRIVNNRSDGNSQGVVHVTQLACSGIIDGNQFWYDDVPAIFLEDASGVTVTNNHIGDGDYVGGGIRLDNADDCIVADNFIFAAGQHGIALVDSKNNIIHDNSILDCSTSTNNTYDGIFIDGNSDDNSIQGNKVSKDPVTTLTNQHRYGIRIDDATCNNNLVTNNHISAAGTAEFSDAGTATSTGSGNMLDGAWASDVTLTSIPFSAPDTLTVHPGKGKFSVPYPIEITRIRGVVDTAPTGASIIVDVNKNGTTIFTTVGNRPTIAAGNTTSTTTQPDITSFAQDDLISVDIDQVGSTIPGADLTLIITYKKA